MDPASIAAAISLFKTALDALDRLKPGKANPAEQQATYDQLREQFYELRETLVGARDHIAELERTIAALTARRDLRSALDVQDEVYFLATETAGWKPGHYCPRCLDGDEKTIRVNRATEYESHVWRCPNCKSEFGSKVPKSGLDAFVIEPERPRRGYIF